MARLPEGSTFLAIFFVMLWPFTRHAVAIFHRCGIIDRQRRGALRGDLAIRRSIEQVVFEVRTEIANVCQEMADKCGEPPLDDDA
jgi:hypothetical protein